MTCRGSHSRITVPPAWVVDPMIGGNLRAGTARHHCPVRCPVCGREVRATATVGGPRSYTAVLPRHASATNLHASP